MAFAVMLRLEQNRRFGGMPRLSGALGGCEKFLKQCAPEVICALLVLGLAFALRLREDPTTIGDASWDRIKQEWPLLVTADSLLGIQAMLRFLVFVLAALRFRYSEVLGSMPILDECAALALFAHVFRAAVFFNNRDYMVEGPLGGYMPSILEVAVIPCLIVLGGWKMLARSPVSAVFIVGSVLLVASRHHLNLSADQSSNLMWVGAHLLDLLAAFAYFQRSLCGGDGSHFVGFTHVLMSVQQSLAAYYFFHAFEESPSIIGSGSPVLCLQLCGVLQLAAYIGAFMTYVMERCELGRSSRGTFSNDSSMISSGMEVQM